MKILGYHCTLSSILPYSSQVFCSDLFPFPAKRLTVRSRTLLDDSIMISKRFLIQMEDHHLPLLSL